MPDILCVGGAYDGSKTVELPGSDGSIVMRGVDGDIVYSRYRELSDGDIAYVIVGMSPAEAEKKISRND